MGTTAATINARIQTELSLLGDFTNTQTEIVKDALAIFCRKADPIISASLTVTSGTTVYSFPNTIDKVTKIEDSDGDDIFFALSTYKRKLTLDDDPASGTYTVYGTPKDVRTNIATILTALDENAVDVLWSWVQYKCYDMTDSDKSQGKYLEADRKTNEYIYYQNRQSSLFGDTVQARDAKGGILMDAGNPRGVNANYGTYLETDSY